MSQEPEGLLAGDADGGGAPSAPLRTGRGTTTISETVVAKIAGIATREVAGVQAEGAGPRHTLAKLGLGDERTRGVSVEVGEREAAADIEAVVEYGTDVRHATEQVRENVVRRIEDLTGLSVVEVNVVVRDVRGPEEGDADQGARTDGGQDQPQAVKRLQRRRGAHREHGAVYRSLWTIAGFTVLVAGVVLIAFPGPAFLVIPIGLAMLSLEFAWAQRLLDTGVSGGQRVTRRIERADRKEKVLGTIAIALALLAGVALVLTAT